MTHDEMIAVIQAHKEGKQIQYSYDGSWSDCIENKPWWNFDIYDYRVKPEPKYRPYKSAEEFLKAQKEHGPYFIRNGCLTYVIPLEINNDSVGDKYFHCHSFMQILEYYKWQDGTPCGVKVEE